MSGRWLNFLNRFLFGDDLYTANDSTLQDPYLDQEAFVIETITPGRRGQVSWGGSFWLARCTHPISLMPGTLVRIKGRGNITLLVEPIYHLLPAAPLEKRS